MKKDVIILTISEKYKGKCVAAYDIKDDKLLRLVSDKNGGSIPNCLVENITVLDVVEVDILEECAKEHQLENVRIDLLYGMVKKDTVDDYEVLDYLNTGAEMIFGNSSYKLYNCDDLDHSLEIIEFKDMRILLNESGKAKAYFKIGDKLHSNYAVTDNNYFGRETVIPEGYAVISLPLSDDFTRRLGYFKYVSAIYEMN